jgi:hypothetical protein
VRFRAYSVTDMRLGFAVKVLGAGGLPSDGTRRWQSGPHLSVSLDRLEAILGYLEYNAVGMYRSATGVAPCASHPDLPGVPPMCSDVDVMLEAKAKDLAPRRLREQLAARGIAAEAAVPSGGPA